MKRSCLAALLLVAACQRPQPEAADPTRIGESTEPAMSAAAAATLQRVGPFLQGVWVKSAYLEAIARTKSPIKAADQLTDVVALSIDPRKAVDDSLPVEANINNHEGTSFQAILRAGRQTTALPTNWPDYQQPTNSYELSYHLTPADTFLLLNKYSAQKRLLQSVRYTRIPGVLQTPTAASDGLQRVVNQQLLAGAYTATDASGQTKRVQFLPDGKVEGLANFRQYYIATDFVVTVENNLDNLIFDLGTKRQQDFVFTIRQDTVRLYQARVQDPDLLRGPLQYTLVRIR